MVLSYTSLNEVFYLYSGNGLKPISAYPGPRVLVGAVTMFARIFDGFENGLIAPDIAKNEK